VRSTDQPLRYPKARCDDQVDLYHGTAVSDPYRWLEDPDSPESRIWIEEQNRLTFGFLDRIPARDGIKERLTRLWNFERYGIPWRKGGRYFLTRNDGLQNQDVFYTMRALDDVPQILLDPNLLSNDGTVAVVQHAVSEDGRFFAYGFSISGSDWVEIRIRDVETGRDLDDRILWVKFSAISWDHEGNGFFYSRYDEPDLAEKKETANYYHKLLYHRIGTDQSEDPIIYERPDRKEWGFTGNVTEDGRYLIIHAWRGTERANLIFYKDLTVDTAKIVELISEFEAEYEVLGNDATTFWLRTDRESPRGRIVTVDIDNPDKEHWSELVTEREETLIAATVVSDRFVSQYLRDAYSMIRIHDLSGLFVTEVELPGIGTVLGFEGRRDENETFYSFTGFTVPETIYRYDLNSGESTLFRQPNIDFEPDGYETTQVFYESKDGTRVPMFITHKKGLNRDGTNPTFLYGYGGFNISLTPAFTVGMIVWMEMGGIYAVANLRGGGEYGEQWHKAGMKSAKQSVFDDFIAGAEWLVENRYTSTAKLAIGGGSNGGLLIGASITQRPDLFGAALPSVGVLDMLRFHKFTIGWAWVSDYGSPDNPEEFEVIYAYSPLHRLKSGTAYPATLITTADHDDRVVPAHSFKFAAALQAAQGGSAPCLIRIETKAGHGMGKPTAKLIEELTDRWAFLVWALRMDKDSDNPAPID